MNDIQMSLLQQLELGQSQWCQKMSELPIFSRKEFLSHYNVQYDMVHMIWSILYGPYPWYFQKSLLSSKFRENTFLPPTVNLSNIKTLYNTICRVTGVFIIVSNSKTNTGRYQKSAATIFPEIEYNSSKNNRSHPNKERIVRLTQTADFVRYFNTRSVSWIVPLLMKYMSSVYKKYIFDRLRKKL